MPASRDRAVRSVLVAMGVGLSILAVASLFADSIRLTAEKTTVPGEVALTWAPEWRGCSNGQYTLFGGSTPPPMTDLGTQSGFSQTDTPPAGEPIYFYQVSDSYPVTVSFSGSVQPIFTANCVDGCHTGVAPSEGLNLSAGRSYPGLVNVTATQCVDGRKLVLPGAPTASYLMDKLDGVNLCSGSLMPKIGSMSQSQIETIRYWICEGAPNN